MLNVSIVVPVYNEEEMIPLFLEEANKRFVDDDKYHYSILFVNDGSKDKTLEILKEASLKYKNISFVSFSRNFGQDAALAAGLSYAKGDVVIPMDCDLQDPPYLIKEMLKKYEEGYEIVNPQRVKRDGDSFMKKKTSGMFYKFINKISGRKVMPENVSQFRLISRRALNEILKMPEKVRMLRSEVPFVGFKTCTIEFERQVRGAGKTKYNYRRIFNFAGHTITNSTDALLNWPLFIGLFFSALGGIGFLTTLILYLIDIFAHVFNSSAIPLFLIISSIILAVGLISLVVFIPCLYLKDMFVNTQGRPTYIVEEYHEGE